MSGGAPAPSRSVRVGVAVPAAGSGTRMGGVRKAFLELAGEPVLLHALRPLLAETRVVHVVVALAGEEAGGAPEWLLDHDSRLSVVAGGATRTQSVRAAIAALPSDLDAIAVHDAARPLVTTDVVSSCIELALAGFGAVAGCPAVDTMKHVDPDGSVLDTPDRSRLWHAQTPQVFPAPVLRAAYADPAAEGTDDAALVERADPSVVIRMVDAGPSNLKVTRPLDVLLAEAILRDRRGA
ncbi:MAG TPA: 2-C-methyl-D-erythritol 4-phosphate cytidylyltransferase [Candidatus Limnocylindrales bacterium]|nr:2-C-methyl-D-erythritol 4-phosphate cytidylyltransferase [Candidatus Limnocylindrales bacterium]